MKKLRGILLMSVVAIGLVFTACNNDDINVPIDGQKGNTHVSVTLKLSSNGGGTRALPEDYNKVGEWAGNDVINNLTIYLVDGASVSSKDFEVGKTAADGKAYMINSAGVLVPNNANTDAAIRTTAGQKTVYVVVNPTAKIKAHLNKTSVAEFDNAYQQIAFVAANSGTGNNKLAASTSASELAEVVSGADAIVMTNVTSATLDVQDGVTAEQTVGASVGNAALNRVSLQVERAVARVMTTTEATTYNIPTSGGGSILGTLKDITWVLAQGENSLYVQHKVDWATPNYAWVPTSQALYETEAGDKYDYSGLYESYKAAPSFGGTAIPTIADYSTADLIGDASVLNGKFVLPTTHEYGVKDASKYKKGNTAYVLIRAKFTPADGAWGDSGVKATDGTFYVGSNGKIYTSAQAAYNDTKSTTITKYEGGKVLYYAWVNPDENPEWYNSPVLRNNIYHIHITGIKNLGTNWNPLFPEDPARTVDTEAAGYDPNDPNSWTYFPKDNPDPKPTPDPVYDSDEPGTPIIPVEPENPIDPQDPLTTPETWMSVDVSILPWLVHSYDVELGI